MYYLFLDESGDHGLSNINPSFPIFVLSGVLFEQSNYEIFRDMLNSIKQKYWGNKEVIFHSSDIRKMQKEFQILFDKEIHSSFIHDVNEIVSNSVYTIIADGIDKISYINRYGKLSNVYELSLSFIIERAIFFLDDIPGDKQLCIVIEERGKKEDRLLAEHFNRLLHRGTGYVKPDRLKGVGLRIEFRSKRKNINGLQLADLVAYPIARFLLDKGRANPAFDILMPKIYSKNGSLYGLKLFP